MTSIVKNLLFFAMFFAPHANAQAADTVEISELKAEIISLAETFQGQGDEDFSKQNQLQILVDQLLELNPQAPIQDRLPLLYGTWYQVWGPYNYTSPERIVDPELGVKEIYQVVSPEGHYYNVSPNYRDGDLSKERIGLLRGEYTLSKDSPNGLDVKFTKFPGVSKRPTDKPIWELASQAEEGTLQNGITIVPTFVVRWFFGGGTLVEVYTDQDLRITYGTNSKNFKEPFLYIMTKQN